ncbi:DENN domain-containing protein 5B-like isoform X2 [Littorina saxatilis]|uniref:DENN domain-containing protein 5B-like isoform X2 n=1 Tax=Littorina saxatilis TaxID=31220 RepID=UPI0038B5DC27
MAAQPVIPNRLVDYFVICGLDASSGLEPDRLSGDNLQCAPLDRPFKSKVLAHYPESVPWIPFDKAAVGMLCMPRGLSFKTQRDKRINSFHSFIITREDGSRCHGAALVFFEEVTSPEVCTAMQTLHAMHSADAIVSLPVFTLGSGDSPEMVKKISERRIREKFHGFDSSRDKLFVTKCICLMTSLPYMFPCRNFLHQLYDVAMKSASACALPLEAYVCNVIYEVPLLPPGRSMKFYGPQGPIYCQRPNIGEPPLFDLPLWELFRLLGVDNVLSVFICLLLEHQVLFYSSDYQRLMLVAEGVNCLIFPFTWQHVYVPILPASLVHFLDAPVPFIMGLYRCSHEARSELTLPSEANMCFVDLDEATVDVPEEIPIFPYSGDLRAEIRSLINQYTAIFTKEKQASSQPTTPRHGNKAGGLSTESSGTGSYPNSPKRMEILQQSEAWKKISNLAKKTGVWESLEDFAEEEAQHAASQEELKAKVIAEQQDGKENVPVIELEHLKFNNAAREIFLNCFVHMFLGYENFVVNPSQDMESWLNNRETMHNFDKAAFLSDQPESHLPFLSPFIESQMFTTMIDNKIMSQWEETDPYLCVFDTRIKALRDKLGEARTVSFHPCNTIEDTTVFIEKRATHIDHVSPKPRAPSEVEGLAERKAGIFPILSAAFLNTEPSAAKFKTRENMKWRRKDRLLQHAEHLQLNSDQREKDKYFSCVRYIQEARTKQMRQPQLSDMSAAGMVQTNWKFVETLLKECKTKTKKMLVEKMGQEAVELGHGEGALTGVEENTLIASLCDLLERIWSHGLQTKKGKSAVWSHLLSFQEVQESKESNNPVDPKMLTPGLPKRHSLIDITSLMEGSITILGRSISLSNLSTIGLEPDKLEKPPTHTHRRRSSQGRIELPVLRPLPKSLNDDMKKVQQMTDIHSGVGYTRAWVRLALERKMLSTHLKELLSDASLLRALYKRYAFLRCEDEREQFLYHLLSLNAVDFFCFTSTFSNTLMTYKVLVFPSTKLGCSTTSANVWLSVAGQLGDSGRMDLPKGLLELTFDHKNLGVLTTMRIGHDNSGMMPRWLVEYILVRSELTGHTYKFNCGRWLGKGVDDGSTERLLVAELMHSTVDADSDEVVVQPVIKTNSPKSPRKTGDTNPTMAELQEMVGHAVNNLVKHFYKPEKERGNLTFLLCGEKGLAQCMEQVFHYGFRSSRLFRNKIFIWDYLERLKLYFENAMANSSVRPIPEVNKAGYWLFCNLIKKINQASEAIGKDGKFQIFICVGIRDRCLHRWLPLMASTTVTAQMYEENSFMRNPSLTNFIVHILDSLTEFEITLESSLLRGLDI